MTNYTLYITPKERKALKGSIEGWRKEVSGGDRGPCPLCVFDCKTCPIGVWTGTTGCNETPYFDWVKTLRLYDKEARKAAAKVELQFLINLEKNSKDLK